MGRAAIIAGAGIAGAGVVIAAGFVKAAKMTAEFEFKMSFLKATLQATEDEMDKLREAALRFGRESGFGPREVADAFVELGKAGVSAEQIIGGVGEAVVTLGQSADIALADASSIIVSTQATFGLLASEASRTADIIQGAANASLIDVADFGVTMKYVGGVAAAAGVSLEDTATAIALLGNAGIRGSTAGTSLRRMLLQLTPRTDKAAAAMKELGIITRNGENRFYDAQGRAKSFRDVFEILKTSTEGLTEAKTKDALATIFGDRAIAAALITARAGAKGYDEFNKQLNESTAAETAKTRFDNLEGALRRFKGAVEAAFIAAGSPAQEPLKNLVILLTDLVNKFAELPPGMQQFIVKSALATAGVLILVGTLGVIAGSILRLVALWKTLGGLFTALATRATAIAPRLAGFFIPLIKAVPRVLGIVGLVVTALVLLEKYTGIVSAAFDKAKQAFSDFAAGFQQGMTPFTASQGIFHRIGAAARQAFDKAKEALAGFLLGFRNAGSGFSGSFFYEFGQGARKVFDAVVRGATALWNALKTGASAAVGGVVTFFRGLGTQLAAAFTTVKDAFVNGFLPALRSVAQSIAAEIGPRLQSLKDAFFGLVETVRGGTAAGTGFGDALRAIGGFLADVGAKIGEVAQFIITNIVPAFAAFAGFLIGTVAPILLQISGFLIKIVLQSVIDFAKGVIQALQGAFNIIAGIFNFFKALFTGNWQGMWDAIKQIVGGALDLILGVIKAVLNFGIFKVVGLGFQLLKALFRTSWDTIVRVVLGALNGMKSGVSTVWNGIKNFFVAVFTAIKTFFVNAWNGLKQTSDNALTGMKNFILSAFNTIKSWFTTYMAFYGNIFRAGWNLIRDAISIALNAIKTIITTIFNGIKSFISGFIPGMKSLLVNGFNSAKDLVVRAVVAMKDGAVNGFKGMIDFVKSIPGKIKSALGNLGNLLKDAGRQVIDGLINGVKSKIEDLKGVLSGITGLIPDIKGPPAKDKVLLENNGRLIMGGLIRGIESQIAPLSSLLRGVGAGMPAAIGTSGGAVAAGNATGGTTVNLDLHFEGQFGAGAREEIQSAVYDTSMLDDLVRAARAGVGAR